MPESQNMLDLVRLAHLVALEQEGVPDVKVGLDRERVDEHAEEPVEGEQRRVDPVLLEMPVQLRQLLAEDLLQDFLKFGREKLN